MDNQTTQEAKTWTVNGRRYFGGMKKNIPTEIRIQGQQYFSWFYSA